MVTDSHLDTNSLKYQWTLTGSAPEEKTFGTSFTNSGIITNSNGNGNYYLWILAKDTAGNTTITGSNPFNIDTTSPTVTIAISKEYAKSGDSVIITGTFNEDITEGTPKIVMAGVASLTQAAMTRIDAKTYTYTYAVPA
jgi:hypothetical protein